MHHLFWSTAISFAKDLFVLEIDIKTLTVKDLKENQVAYGHARGKATGENLNQ